MKVLQLLPTLAFGDAVGNDAIAMHRILVQLGYETKIYAENIDSRINRDIAESYLSFPAVNQDDLIIYHFSIGSVVMRDLLMQQCCRRIMVYHNITPAKYFSSYDKYFKNLVDKAQLKGIVSFAIADSEYNRRDLLQAGYTCPICVLPILIPFRDYAQAPDAAVLEKYRDDNYTNILFVGRMAPNKKIEDVIRAFAYYKRQYNARSRLFLVGSDRVLDLYSERIRRYIKRLALEDSVIISAHVPFTHILAYYRLADVFLCMSEHEGFCVPLVEAMYFSVPVVARSMAAVPETLGNAGLLLDSEDSAIAASAIHEIVSNASLRSRIQDEERSRLQAFSSDTIREHFTALLSAVCSETIFSENDTALSRKTENIFHKETENIIQRAMHREQIELPKFEEIPIPISMPERQGLTWRQIVRQKILKPGYYWLHRFAPSLADAILVRANKVSVVGVSQSMPTKRLAIMCRQGPGILVDVGYTAQQDWGTGIQRVVNNVVQYMTEQDKTTCPARNSGGRLITAKAYLARLKNKDIQGEDEYITFQKGDILFCLDSSWEWHEDFSRILADAKKAGAKVYGIVYDLFPIQYPEVAAFPYFSQIFAAWHDMMLQKADGVICISRTTADVVADYFHEKKFQREKPLAVYHFPMGSAIIAQQGKVRDSLKSFAARKQTFLMVGTVEPRKGHGTVLKALRKVLPSCDVQLLIIGRDGWKNDDIKTYFEDEALKTHVLWVQDAADHELQWAYQNTAALIAASKDEGYGLPLIEAAYFGQPIICSDIPIFHEVTQEHATYFKVLDEDALAEVWKAWMQETAHPDSREIRLYTWSESAQAILDILKGKTPAYKVLQ